VDAETTNLPTVNGASIHTSPAFTTDIHAATAGGATVGTAALPFSDLYIAGTSGTPATNHYKITGASTGGERTITLPNQNLSLAGTMTDGKLCTYTASGTIINCATDPSGFTGGTLTSLLTLRTGTTGAGTSPVKFVSGPVMTTPEAGAMEFTTDALYFTTTTGPNRKTVAFIDSAQTWTGVQSLTSPAIATSITTADASFTAFAGATTLLTLGGTGASASVFAPSTLDSTTSTTGAIRTSGGLSAAKNVFIGEDLTVLGADITLLSASAGAKITGGDRTITLAGTSANAESLVFTMGSNDNIVTVSSGTGATQLGFSALNLVTTGTITGGIPSVGTFASPTTSSGTYSLAAANAWGSMIFYNDTDTLALPAAVAGMNVCIYATSTNLTTIDPNGTDVIVVDGVANAAGDAFTLAAAAGNFVCLLADAANHWVTLGAKGTLSPL
jgi:hypothetical protein